MEPRVSSLELHSGIAFLTNQIVVLSPYARACFLVTCNGSSVSCGSGPWLLSEVINQHLCNDDLEGTVCF